MLSRRDDEGVKLDTKTILIAREEGKMRNSNGWARSFMIM
jgi:hypothetical protein